MRWSWCSRQICSSSSISHRVPPKCTAITALVRSVTASRTRDGIEIVCVLPDIDEHRNSAPSRHRCCSRDERNGRNDHFVPRPDPEDLERQFQVTVPLKAAIPCSACWYRAKLASNSATNGMKSTPLRAVENHSEQLRLAFIRLWPGRKVHGSALPV